MPSQLGPVDKEKLRAAVRRLGPEYIFYMLDDAIELLPKVKLAKIAAKYLDLDRLRPDSDKKKSPSLLADVKAFDEASRRSAYYESFLVDSRNCMEKSMGTLAWISDYHRLLDRCVAAAKDKSATELREAFEILFGLLDYIDEANDDVIFFADDGGSWELGIDWRQVLPPYFKVLSVAATPEEYASRVSLLIERRCPCNRDQMLAIARRTAAR